MWEKMNEAVETAFGSVCSVQQPKFRIAVKYKKDISSQIMGGKRKQILFHSILVKKNRNTIIINSDSVKIKKKWKWEGEALI